MHRVLNQFHKSRTNVLPKVNAKDVADLAPQVRVVSIGSVCVHGDC